MIAFTGRAIPHSTYLHADAFAFGPH